MKKLWRFLSKPQNLAVVIALSGGLGFLWKEVVAPNLSKPDASPSVAPASKNPTTSAPQNVQAEQGAIAVGARDNAKVTINQNAVKK